MAIHVLTRFEWAQIANDDRLIRIYNLPREFTQGILTASCGAPVRSLRLALVTTPLGLGDFLLDVTVIVSRLAFFAITCYRCVFQSQIDANGLFGSHRVPRGTLDGQTQPPVTDRVLRETTRHPDFAVQQLLFESPDRLTAKA
jgi:hypothetical protein